MLVIKLLVLGTSLSFNSMYCFPTYTWHWSCNVFMEPNCIWSFSFTYDSRCVAIMFLTRWTMSQFIYSVRCTQLHINYNYYF